jgi:GAF domain-containing protein
MAENLHIVNGNKDEKYKILLPQIEALIAGENNLIANLANTSAAIQMTFNHLWVGFYLIENNQLVLGPFQGPIACTRITMGKGVCGTSWERNETVIVKNVAHFEGHISCSSESVSEIVIPLRNPNDEIIGVLDIDSTEENTFGETDQQYLEQALKFISKRIK